MYTQIHRWSYLTAPQLLRAYTSCTFHLWPFSFVPFFLFLILHNASTPVSGQDKETRTPSAVCVQQSQNLSAFLICLLFCSRCKKKKKKKRRPPRIHDLTREVSTMKKSLTKQPVLPLPDSVSQGAIFSSKPCANFHGSLATYPTDPFRSLFLLALLCLLSFEVPSLKHGLLTHPTSAQPLIPSPSPY